MTTGIYINESDLQSLFDSVADYVIAINRNHQIIMSNDLFKNRFGAGTGSKCYKAWKNLDTKCDLCPVEKSFQDGLPHSNKETVVRNDGEIITVHVKTTPVRDDRGKIAYVVETVTDLTEKNKIHDELNRVSGTIETTIRKRLKQLEKYEELYRTIFERSLDAIVFTDSKGNIQDVNQAGVRILGYRSKQNLLSLESALDLFENEEDLYHFQKTLFKEGFVLEFETRLKGKGGKVFDALITSNVILDIVKQITGYALIIRDITKSKRTQQKIEEQNSRLSILNAIATTVNSTLDLKEMLNKTTDKMHEILEADSFRLYLLDEKRENLDLVGYKGLSANFIEKPFMRRRKVGDGLLGITALTGETKVVDNFLRSGDPYVKSFVEERLHSTIYLPLLSRGETMGVIAVSNHPSSDFTDEYIDFLNSICNQIGVALSNADLYKNMKTAYQDLKEAQEQVIRAEKLASLGKLSASIAHEINNPLAAVLTYARLMTKLITLGRFTPDRFDDVKKYLKTIQDETSRCGEIVKNLLAFSRQSKMKFEIRSIEKIIDKTLLLVSHDLQMKGIIVEKNISQGTPDIVCDFKQIQQALLNLFINASDAMPEGGVLTVTTADSSKDGFLEISISDSGHGMSEEDLKDIFEPFFSTKEEGKGVGLGLSVTYGIITEHRGKIEVESKVGNGTTFKVYLPDNSENGNP
jgi:PAS domain S-box-containing protein